MAAFLQILLCLCIAVSLSAGNPECSITSTQFTLKNVRMCLKPEFVKIVEFYEFRGDEECAKECLKQGDICQGFGMMGKGLSCSLYLFNQCSHDINRADCQQTALVYVHHRQGVRHGDLCPDGYGNQHGTSVYKRVSAKSWSEGKRECQTEFGLAKYADASDKAEAAHMHGIKTKFNGLSFFIGGHHEPKGWFWTGCDRPMLKEVWGTNQPNENGCCTDIWKDHKDGGVDDTPETDAQINHALCECVDPFRIDENTQGTN